MLPSILGILIHFFPFRLEIFVPKKVMEFILTFGDKSFNYILKKTLLTDVPSYNITSKKISKGFQDNVVNVKQMKQFESYLDIFDEMNIMKEEYEKKELVLQKAITSHENTEKDLQKKITDLLFEISLLKNKKRRRKK